MATRPRTRSYSLPFGELMTRTFAVYLRNFVPFFLLSLVVLSPWAALKWLFNQSMLEQPAKLSEQYPEVAMSLGLGALQGLLGVLLTGTFTYGVVQQLRGAPAGIGTCLSTGFSSFGRVLGTAFLAGIRIAIGTMLCYVPGIIESCRLFIAVPAALMEGRGASASIERSIRLTQGSRWQIFGVIVFVYGILIALPIVVNVWATVNHGPEARFENWFFTMEVLVTAVVQIASGTASAVAYFMLRKGKENIDVKELAAVFD